MQKARRRRCQLRPLVDVRFQGLFTPLLRVLFTFPSRYWCTIGLSGVFSLTGWCRHIQTGFHRSRPTQFTIQPVPCTGLSPSTARLPSLFHYKPYSLMGFSPFARHYSGNKLRSLFLQVLRCFSSPRSRSHAMSSTWQVPPFGHLWITDRLHLPTAFRSLPRPSSPLRA